MPNAQPLEDRLEDRPKRARGIRALAAILLSAALVGPAALPAHAAEEVNRIVLRVNDQIFTLHEYEQRKAEQIQAILGAQGMGADERQQRLAEVGRIVMNQTFDELLVQSRAEQLSIQVDEVELEQAVEQVRVRQGIESREEMLRVLASMGMTIDQVRDNLRQELKMQKVMGREVQGRIEVGEEELRAFYRNNVEQFEEPEQRQLKEVIVLESSGLGAEERQRLAEEIRAQLETGAAFDEVVAPYQERGETTGVLDLGWLAADELEPIVAEAAFSLEIGQYSQPVEARGGTHLIYAEGVEEKKVRSFSEVQDQIQAYERSRRFRTELRQYMAELEEDAYVYEDLPPEAVGYRNLIAEPETEDELDFFLSPLPGGGSAGGEGEENSGESEAVEGEA